MTAIAPYAWHAERPRTIAEVRADVRLQMARKHADLAQVVRHGEPVFGPASRSLRREIAALRRRLAMLDAAMMGEHR